MALRWRQRAPLSPSICMWDRRNLGYARAGWRRCRTLSGLREAARASLTALRHQAIRLLT